MAMASLPRSWQDHGKILARLPRNLPWILARMPWLQTLGLLFKNQSPLLSETEDSFFVIFRDKLRFVLIFVFHHSKDTVEVQEPHILVLTL